jgi:AcrR family transcriptional regulator
MDGRTKRTQRIITRIKETALELFSSDGVAKVSMDEIAKKANVSKVTIYKHFHSKEELHREVINLWSDKVFTATEQILNSDLAFLDKLKLILTAQVNKPPMADNTYLFELLEKDAQAAGIINERLKKIIFRFFEEGKRKGYIDDNIPFKLFYLHSEIYRAGYRAKLAEAEAIVGDKQTVEKMNDLFFFGIIKRR